MDTVRLLGSLLGNNAMGGAVGSQLAGNIGGGGRPGGALQAVGKLFGGGASKPQATAQSPGSAFEALIENQGSGAQAQAQAQGIFGNVVTGALASHTAQIGGGGIAAAIGGFFGGGNAAAAVQQQPQYESTPVAGLEPQQAIDQATLFIRAMCNAAKCDGHVDAEEQQNILGRLGHGVDDSDVEYLKEELERPLNVSEFVRQVPSDLKEEVYAMSVMAINVDTQAEAQYLSRLASGLGITTEARDHIHQKLNAPTIVT